MKEMLFRKEDSELIQSCLSEFARNNPKKIRDCERLMKKFQRAEKKIKVSSAKGKGRALQYWVCEKIAKIFNVSFVQSDDNCLIHSREMGQHGTDVVLRGKIYKEFPYDIECKSCETLSVPEWVRQARANCKVDRDWLLVFHKQTIGGNPLVIMEWDSFEKLFREKRK